MNFKQRLLRYAQPPRQGNTPSIPQPRGFFASLATICLKFIFCFAPHLTASDKKLRLLRYAQSPRQGNTIKYSPASGIFTSLALIYLKFIFLL